MHRHAVENLGQADALFLGWVTYQLMGSAWRPAAPPGPRWTLENAAVPGPDVELLATTRRDLAGYLTTPPSARTAGHPGVRVQGTEPEISRFLGAIAAFPPLRQASAPRV